MSSSSPSPALLPVLLLLGALGAQVPLATAAASASFRPPPPAQPFPGSVELEPGASMCGGLWPRDCEDGMRCVDNPTDACDRARGDTDCPGVCVSAELTPAPTSCRRMEPARRFVSHEPPLCALLLFRCGAGERPFSDDCGCGCERMP